MKKAILFSLVTFACTHISLAQSPAAISLAKTEKEFSDYTGIHRAPEAWTKYFAPDGIMFAPLPVNAIEYVKPRLGSTKPREGRIRWEAFFTDVSTAGDLGYNIGPSVRENIKYDTVPKQYGYIFSIWKKVNDSTWRVALDAGVDGKEKTPEHELTGKFRTPEHKAPGKLKYTFLEAEDIFRKTALNKGLLAAYQNQLINESQMLRNGFNLLRNKKESLEWIKGNDKLQPEEKMELKVIGSGESKSNDLAYTYGSYLKDKSKEEGLFVHVWKRMNSEWQLVFDVTGPIPQQAKK